MPQEEHFRKLEHMYRRAPINAFFNPTLHVEADRARLTMDVRPQFFHAAAAAHGAVYFKVLDDVFILTVSFTIHFLRPVTGGTLRAEGRVVHRSRRLIVAEGEIFDDAGRLVGRGSGLYMPSQVPLRPEIGYA